MNYELVEQLKDAGFHQFSLPFERSAYNHTAWIQNPGNPDELVYKPTLSELIEACGESFNSLSRVNKNGSEAVADKEDMIWKASCWEQFVLSETPEEAVAKLWLELNKK